MSQKGKCLELPVNLFKYVNLCFLKASGGSVGTAGCAFPKDLRKNANPGNHF